MAEIADVTTSVSLLETLRRSPGDAVAWERFVARYRPMICRWCREWGLQGADAEDVAQDVLAHLTRALGQFRYDPSRCFRAWLKTIAHHAWSDSAAVRLRKLDRKLVERLDSVEARADLEQRFDALLDRDLVEQAMSRVHPRVAATTWDAFRLTALESLSGAEASSRLGISVASVFVARHRVQQMLRREIEKLSGPLGD